MPQKEYIGVKCCTGAILVVALFKASMSTSNTSSMPPVACIYGSECKMQRVGTNTDVKCCGKKITSAACDLCGLHDSVMQRLPLENWSAIVL